MAAGPAKSSSTLQGEAAQLSYDEYIDNQLQKTRGYVRLIDVAGATMTIASIVLAYLLVLAVVDHWLLQGGLGTWGRALAFLVLLAGLGWYFARTVLPHIRYRVNPVYAADKLEQATPTLRNSLVNFLLLRRDHRGVPEVVYRGLQQQAAIGLGDVPVDSAVDRSRLTKIGYVLIGVFVVFALYKVFSPKDPLPSVGRVIAPWADIDPVTRVEIEDISPGDTDAVLFSQVTVSARVRGLRDEEEVTLVYSSGDSQSVDQRIPMYREADEQAHRCRLPGDSTGLAQDVVYRIEAGDCASRTFRITAVTAPTIRVKSVEYFYPSYTKMPTRKVEDIGDIKAIDGTEVLIRAEASQEIDRSTIDLEGLRPRLDKMKHEGRFAYGRVKLRRKIVGNDSVPEFTGYRLRYTTPAGDTNDDPIRHSIEILQDKPPLIEILEPTAPQSEVPLDGELYVEVRARDLDFLLSDVRLKADKDGKPVLDAGMMQHEKADDQPPTDTFRGTFRFVPSRYKLKVGDVIRYVAVARDNKEPEQNESETAQYRIVITEPERPFDPQQQPDPNGADDQQPSQQPEKTEGKDAENQPQGQQGAAAGADDSQQQESKDQAGGGQGSPSEQPDKGSDDADAQARPQGAGEQTGGEQKPSGGEGQSGDQQQDPSGDDPQQQPQPGKGADESQQPVDNDGEAFEKILEKLQEGLEENKGEQPEEKPGDDRQEDGDSRDTSAAKGASGDAKDSGSEEGGQKGGGQQAQDRSTEGEGQPNERPDNQAGDDERAGKGETGSDEESPAGARKSQEPGGSGKGNDGKDAPAPPEGKSKPREKENSGDTGESQKGDEPEDSSVSEKESDSRDGNSGDRSGGGEEGGGQQSPQKGQGAEGKSTPADSGGSRSDERGQGDNSGKAGDDTATDQKTGRQSDQAGDASTGDRGKDGASDNPAEGDPDQQGEQSGDPSKSQPSDKPGQEGEGKAGKDAQRGSRNGDAFGNQTGEDTGATSPAGADAPRQEPGADEGNLEYAKKQHELALEYLEDQLEKDQVDQQLLKDLGWNEQQLRDFYDRWSRLRESAITDEDGDAGRAELDDALRSLGLRPPATQTRTGELQKQKERGLSEGSRSRPPRDSKREGWDAFLKDPSGR